MLIRLIPVFLFLCGCQSLFFMPEANLRYHPAICRAEPIDVVFSSKDGTALHGWFFRAQETPKATVFYLHGNGQNMSTHIHSVLWLTQHGYNIFAFDYRGYGISKGEPDIDGVIHDSLAALDFLARANLPGVGPVIVMGQSLGGALAVLTTAETPHQGRITALITDSAFSSWRWIYRQKAGDFLLTWPFQYPISWFISDDMPPEDFISQIPPEIKILLIHNRGDEVVPFEHSLRLLDASNKRAELWATDYEGHVTANLHEEFREKLLTYMESTL